ncbi:TetR/AcrR family transcriptional regulator [Jiulongibacter sp. NS-SX5]|uniref:TetR/AcrR family transcriptional regulator n=1 Tax=Jiulongibacter sp. NS-SX5 TaxID=3463854 RepID=UPI0040588920
MSIAERKEREKSVLRKKILNAAKELFLTKGYEKTSIRNIADKIEYSPGTIYLYYKDKNELFFKLHLEAFNELGIALSQLDFKAPPIEQLGQMGRNYIRFAFENPELYELMFVMEAPMETLACKDEIWKDGLDSYDMLKSLVDNCMKDGYLKSHGLDDATLMIWSFVHGLVTLKSRQRLEMFEDEEKASFDRMMRSFEVFYSQIKCGQQL